ncbi:MAG: hypothetical protein OXC98_01945 [bacterium]|nr:hypothetical protein [Acidimicrobiia bacterium]MCY4649119.1 hypothetical protein [bacterium]
MSHDLLDRARELITAREGLSGVWPRAAAFLTRQALEEALADLWRFTHPGMEGASWSTQLACLHEVLSDPPLVSDVRSAWASLSRACHYHHYELDPTYAELERWMGQTERLITATRGMAG